MKKLFVFASMSSILFLVADNTKLNYIIENTSDPAYLKVNKEVSIGRFIPKDLEILDKKYTSKGRENVYVCKRIIPDLIKLIEAANKDGLTLKVASGYRSYYKQIKTFDSWVGKEIRKNPKLTNQEAQKAANNYSAFPGHSEHQLGTTVDILSSENSYQFAGSEKLKFAKWLEENCSKYNFKISFKKDNPEYTYEPWHVRWFPPIK